MTAHKSECPAATGQYADETNQHADSLLATQESGKHDGKDYATLQAEFAQRGRKLTHCHHLHDAETYLQQIGHHA